MSGRLSSLIVALGFGLACDSVPVQSAAPLTTLEYQIVGTQLRVSPSTLSVPKGVAGSVAVEVVTGDGGTNAATAAAIAGAHIEATFRGPSFPARRLIGRAGEPLLLPPLQLVGEYQLDDVKLIDSASGGVRMEGTPKSVPVHVFDEVLVSRVTSRPLTFDEIKEKGIVIDEQNFRAVEFEVTFVLRGNSFPVRLPVVAPQFKDPTEIIPRAELEAQLAEAQRINQQLSQSVVLPAELETAKLDIQIQGINFEAGGGGDEDDPRGPPPITGLLVIPGNIGFLNQFFSVQIFTENAAPRDSRLSVVNVRAEMVLPKGKDQLPAASYEQPGDDPLRFARIGPNKTIQNIQAVVRPGNDGALGTADDIPRLQPGETGQAEFLVEGLQEGLHVIDLNLTADLEGLPAGVVKIKGKAAGSVLVRNAKFSLSFSHPRTVRFGEPYQAQVTILNTGDSVANLVSVSLRRTSISGAIFETGQEETVQLGNIAPGETRTATYRLRAQRTGYVAFSNLTTSDDSVKGSFNLTLGVDERGVALSPDSIGFPNYVSSLPTNLFTAAQRVLGQALSVATAARLPANVQGLPRSTVTQRVVDLAEAGQRIHYGDPTNRVLADLLLDWQGGRSFQAGFDQLLRETDAGREFREAFMSDSELSDSRTGVERLADRAADIAGRGEAWHLAAASTGNLETSLIAGSALATRDRSQIPRAAVYRGARGDWLAAPPDEATVFQWRTASNSGPAEISLVFVKTNGTAEKLAWTLTSTRAGRTYTYAVAAGDGLLLADTNGDGTPDSALPAVRTAIVEKAPEVVTILQDIAVSAGRPFPPCPIAEYLNYGTVVAVLFSKPMRQEDVNFPGVYQLDDGNFANAVQIQPGGRIALLNLKRSIGTLRPRTMRIEGIADARGNRLASLTAPVRTTASKGISLQGRVVGMDSAPVAGVPVTLTRFDQRSTPLGCDPVVVREAQVFTDVNGNFTFDFVLADVPYAISATDTSNLSSDTTAQIIQALVESKSVNEASRQKLRELAQQPDARDALLKAFNAGDVNTAIAAAEGLDRAEFRDLVGQTSVRLGSEVPIVLRFRGRGTVVGRVFAANGATPLAAAAVNLFPDIDSRELGRGVLSDEQGNFAFYGVPLGIYTIKVDTSDGRQRSISGFLEHVSQTNRHDIVVGDQLLRTATVRGRLFETDGVTPHANGRVFIGKDLSKASLNGVIAAVSTDADGFWTAPGIPLEEWSFIGVSADSRRRAERLKVPILEGAANFITLQLQGVATVSGRVIFDNGQPARNAHVAGGEKLVQTDANGRFVLTGVPLGARTIEAGLARSVEDNISVTRLGSEQITVLPGIENLVTIKLQPRGRIIGRVLDARGQPQPGIRVAIPGSAGFQWVKADENGRYTFDNMPLSDYILSAPSPPVKEDPEAVAQRTIEQIKQAQSNDEIVAAVKEAFAVFAGVTDATLNPERFNPIAWGYTRTGILFDGHVVTADIHFLPAGSIGGKVVNSQGVAIGADVLLKGIGPFGNGAPAMIVRAGGSSDPGDGRFLFTDAALAGPFELIASSPLFTSQVTLRGTTAAEQPDSTNNLLQFPPQGPTSGRLTGVVLNPDGTPAGEGISVHISLTPDYIITTDTNGFFDTQIKLPAGTYSIQVTNNSNGLLGTASARVLAGITNRTTVTLLDKGNLAIDILLADGTPATNAFVTVTQNTFPREIFAGLRTDAAGHLLLQNIFEGAYSIEARQLVGLTAVAGRTNATVLVGQTATALVRLGASGTVRGQFLANDRITPVPFAQVAAVNLGFATTDRDGRFEFSGMPLGNHRLQARNPVSGRLALGNSTLLRQGETNEVLLVERDLGQINGTVFSGDKTNAVSGAEVVLTVSDGFSPARSITTGPDGAFAFPGTPAGPFTLTARDPIYDLRAIVTGTLPSDTNIIHIDLVLPALASLEGLIVRADGVTPATNATVQLRSVRSGNIALTADTDASGRVRFANLPLDTYNLFASSLIPGETRSAAVTNITLNAAGAATPFTNVLSGVGAITGRVFQSDGTTPAGGAEVRATFTSALTFQQRPLFAAVVLSTFTDNNGAFRFNDVPIAGYQLSVSQQALVAARAGMIITNGQTDDVRLVLGPSGTIRGKLIRSDGVNPVIRADVVVTFASQSSFTGRSSVRTDATGAFSITGIPVGPFTLGAIAPLANGVNGIVLRQAALTSNGQVLDLGNVPLDEDDPSVVNVSPANTAVQVPVNTTIELLFNEPMAPESITTNGIYLRSSSNTVPVQVELLADPTNGLRRLVRLTPSSPLKSQTEYTVVAINGDRTDALGKLVGHGPTDLVGRPLLAPFVSKFTTRDNDPPFLVSQTPLGDSIQIDPRAVIRLVYSEAVRVLNTSVSVRGPAGVVPGRIDLGPELKVAVFTPDTALEPNTTYTVTLSSVRDLSGNLAAGHPLAFSFTTLDTLGPTIASLRLANNQAAVAGSVVSLEALLTTNEPGAQVRFTANLDPIGTATTAPYRINTVLPLTGRVTFRAIATDRFGNDGPFSELVLNVVSNQPPGVRLERVSPVTGPVRSGEAFTILVGASDDNGVTNITLVGGTAVTINTNLPSGTNTQLTFIIPPTTPPGTPLQFNARAFDTLGLSSGTATLDFEVRDGTVPFLAIVSPSNNAILNASRPLEIVFVASDNSTNLQIDLILTGAITATQTVALALSPTVNRTNIFSVSLAGLPATGARLTATVRATDAASNTVSVVHNYTLPDSLAPRLLATSPTNRATQQSLWLPAVVYTFSEALAASTVSSNRFAFTNEAGTAVGYTVALENNGTQASLRPAVLPLLPNTTYTHWLFPGMTDSTGNALLDETGSLLPPGGKSYQFRTASIISVAPSNNTPVVAGQAINVTVNYEPGLGASFFRFTLNEDSPIQVAVSGTATNAGTVIRIPTNSVRAVIAIQASDRSSFTAPYTLAPLVLNVRARDADDDGDGLPNGYEIDHGLNPFQNDAGADADNDGLTNLQEFQRRTDPQRADSDSDGLNDGAEIALGTDPLNPDTDGDGLRDGVDPDPIGRTTGVTFLAPLSIVITEGRTTNLPVQVTSANGSLVLLELASTNPPPLFASLTGLQFTNTATNGVGIAQLVLQPGYADAGSYRVTLRAATATGASGATNIAITVLDDNTIVPTRWKEAVSGDWSDTNRWTDGLPSATKPAIIDQPGTYTVTLTQDGIVNGLTLGGSSGTQTLLVNGRTLTLNGSSSVRSNATLRLSGGGTINGAGLLAVAGLLDSTTGSQSGSGRTLITSGGTLHFGGPNPNYLYRSLDSAGTMDWSSGDLWLLNSTLQNLAGGVFNVSGQNMWSAGGNNNLNNSGIVNKLGTNTTTVNGGISFNNDGQVNLREGMLALTGGGRQNQRITVLGGARLNLAGDFDYPAGSALDGAGTISFSGGTQNIIGQFNPAGAVNFIGGTITINNSIQMTNPLVVASATVNFNTPQSFREINLSGGTLGGSGNLTVTGPFTWTGGSMTGAGRTIITNGGSLQLTGSNPKFLYRSLDTSQTTDWTGGDLWWQNAVFNNLAGAVFNASGANFWSAGGNNRFVNAGTFNKTGTNSTVINGGVEFVNSGTLNLLAGSLWLNSGSNSQLINVAADTTLSFGGDFTHPLGSALRGAGAVRFNGGTHNFLGQFEPTGPVNFIAGSITINNRLQLSDPLNISSATVNFNTAQTFSQINLSGGALGGNGTITITRLFDWTGGTLNGSGHTVIASGATAQLRGPNPKYLYRTLDNNGTTDWRNTGDLWFQNAAFNNLTGAVFTAESATMWSAGGNNAFNNSGIFNKLSTNNATVNGGIAFNNNGQLNVGQGALSLLGGGSNTGTMIVPATTELNLGSDFNYAPGSSLAGAGMIRFNGGTHNFLGQFDPTGTVVFNAGAITINNRLQLTTPVTIASSTVNFNTAQSFTELAMSGGTLGGTGAVTVTRTLDWSGGTMSGLGRTILASGGALHLTGNSAKYLYRSFDNNGTVDWTGGDLWWQNASFNNLAGAVFNSTANNFWSAGGNNAFNNSGTFNKNGTNNLNVNGGIAFNNSGTLNLRGSTLFLNGGGSNGGTITVSSGARLNLSGDFSYAAGSDLGGAGSVHFNTGTHDFQGRLDVTGSINFAGATVDFTTPQTWNQIAVSGGTVQGAGALVVTGSFDWTGGTLRGPGTVTLNNGGTLRLSGNSAKYLYRTFNNNGAAQWTGTGDLWWQNGVFNNLPGATFTADNAAQFYSAGGNNTFNNAGTFTKNSTNITIINNGIAFNNSGTFNVSTGTITLWGGGANSAVINLATNAELHLRVGTYSLQPGSAFAGTGRLRTLQNTVLTLGTNINFGTLEIFFDDNSTVPGNFNISNSPGGVIHFNKSMTLAGSADIRGTWIINATNVTVQVNGTLTLAASGVLNNPGVVRVGAFVNNVGSPGTELEFAL